MKYFNVIALVALGTKIAIIDGVFFQKALRTKQDVGYTFPHNVLVSIPTLDAFPITGTMGSSDDGHGQMNYQFANVLVN